MASAADSACCPVASTIASYAFFVRSQRLSRSMPQYRPPTVPMRPAWTSQRSTSATYPAPERGRVSRPSVSTCSTRSETPSSAASSIAASMWDQPEWTPPSETSAIACMRPRRDSRARPQASRSAGLSKNDPSAIASSIRARSCFTTAPAPRFRWPTSELPIWPGGRPTSRPEVESVVCGYLSQSSSKTGVSARATALPGPSGASPQPSRTIRATAGTGAPAGPGVRVICRPRRRSRGSPPTRARRRRPKRRRRRAADISSAALAGFTEPP